MCEVYGHRMTDVIVEKGVARVFASAVDWPGWCRGGRSEDEALAALIGYAPRYERIFRRDGFTAPKEAAALRVVERVKGNANTERGWPRLGKLKAGTRCTRFAARRSKDFSPKKMIAVRRVYSSSRVPPSNEAAGTPRRRSRRCG